MRHERHQSVTLSASRTVFVVGLQRGDLTAPVLQVESWHKMYERCGASRASPTIDTSARTTFSDFRRIDIDVDDLRPRRERRRLPRHAIVEPAAEVQQHVALPQCAIDLYAAVHSRHPKCKRMIERESAQPVKCCHDWDPACSANFRSSRVAPAWITPLPTRSNGRREVASSVAAPRSCRLSAVRTGRYPGSSSGLPPLGSQRRSLSVLCHIDVHRPRAPSSRYVKSFSKYARQILRSCHEIVVLRDRQRDAGDVDFLKGIRAQQTAGDPPVMATSGFHPCARQLWESTDWLPRSASRCHANSNSPARTRAYPGRVVLPHPKLRRQRT